eukprot:TRINITY_DN10502_c0_g2_i1.p1 TRINITY_DN10502_c0_g2~~TRINITY_DN10502_c0_g2_i1.p1  ORF type:complete len:168 (-),score=26.98 TRINITY_DN10502_c0_g2_i1:36-539(-)
MAAAPGAGAAAGAVQQILKPSLLKNVKKMVIKWPLIHPQHNIISAFNTILTSPAAAKGNSDLETIIETPLKEDPSVEFTFKTGEKHVILPHKSNLTDMLREFMSVNKRIEWELVYKEFKEADPEEDPFVVFAREFKKERAERIKKKKQREKEEAAKAAADAKKGGGD